MDEAAEHALAPEGAAEKAAQQASRDRPCDRPRAPALRRPCGSCSGRIGLLGREGDLGGGLQGEAGAGLCWGRVGSPQTGQGAALRPRRHRPECALLSTWAALTRAGFGGWCEWRRAQPGPSPGHPPLRQRHTCHPALDERKPCQPRLTRPLRAGRQGSRWRPRRAFRGEHGSQLPPTHPPPVKGQHLLLELGE